MAEAEPSFLCGNCNTKAPLRLKFCPNCKASFSLVVCSNCTHKGPESDFIKGCPICNYLNPQQDALNPKVQKKSFLSNFFLNGSSNSSGLRVSGLALTAVFFVFVMLTLLWLYDRLVYPLLP